MDSIVVENTAISKVLAGAVYAILHILCNIFTPDERVYNTLLSRNTAATIKLNHASSESLINLAASAERAVMEHLKGRSCLTIVNVLRPDHLKLCQDAP